MIYPKVVNIIFIIMYKLFIKKSWIFKIVLRKKIYIRKNGKIEAVEITLTASEEWYKIRTYFNCFIFSRCNCEGHFCTRQELLLQNAVDLGAKFLLK